MIRKFVLPLFLLIHDPAMPNADWYEKQTDSLGRSCCHNNDWGTPTDWRRGRVQLETGDYVDGFQVFWREAWWDVPPFAVLSGRTPDGSAVLWYRVSGGKLFILCFAAGAES